MSESRATATRTPGRRREDLQAARCVDGDHAPGGPRAAPRRARTARRALRRSPGRRDPLGDRVARSGSDGLRVGLIKKPSADRERPRLVEGRLAHTEPAATTPRSRKIPSACGPGRPPSRSRTSSRSTTPRSRSRNVRSPSSPLRAVASRPPRDAARDRASAKACDHGRVQTSPVRRAPWDVPADDPTGPDGERALEHDHARCWRQRGADLSSREWPEGLQGHRPYTRACSRCSSMTSARVPLTDPSATMIVSASAPR